MNRRVRYSTVVFVTGTKRVVPGRLTFHALKANSPGSPVGRSARPSSSVSRASRKRRVISSPGPAGAAATGLRLAPAQAHDVEPGVVGEEELGGVRVHRAGPRAADPAVHPGQAVGRQVAQREPRDAGAQPHEHRLLQLGQRDGLGVRGVRQRAARQGHPEAEPPRAPAQDGVRKRELERLLQPGRQVHGGRDYSCGAASSGFSITDRMFPAGSRNQAMSGPSPRKMPRSSVWSSPV